ncbi:DNA repair protein RadC [Pedobacter changchengzhani]|uniref:DNA repair protein RadC n=1 Tax=Pedobacter changchengzhani TaxID=2529274 RepID=A0A4R5MN96_9SPHI|nr:DNA repair protein RadC [Pedobacter changchengzhani]TDG36775.1 DNA repair protein RadC [Pedobacter changchengzhani]
MENYEQKLGIKLWAEEDRPREKLLLHGRRHLTDAELIAILIGSGNRTETAVDLSKRILAFYGNSLTKLGRASIQELSKFKGIGDAKAISIIAALELGLRRKETIEGDIVKVTASTDVWNYMRQSFSDLNHEEFWILLLNRANHILSKHLISKGGQAGTVADPKIIFKVALENNAANIVLMHNHPSGNLKPSSSDIKLTKDMVEAGKLLTLFIADHLIFANNNYFSFKDEGLVF